MKLVVFGLTISSSWGNGHATLWRGLTRALARRGHTTIFFERDVPYYAQNRDLDTVPGGELVLYEAWESIRDLARRHVVEADCVIVTSYCADGLAATKLALDAARGIRVFYDLDTPVTLARLDRGERVPYLGEEGLAGFDLVLSYTGGRALDALKTKLGAKRTAPFYGHVDPDVHGPAAAQPGFAGDLSYLGTYAADRQQALADLFIEPARQRPDARFVIAGAQYPQDFPWTPNIFFVRHLPPSAHPAFYASSRFTLNVTRQDMAAMGWCPSGRLFEAAACGSAILTDDWEGLDEFFDLTTDLRVVRSADDTLAALDLGEAERRRMGEAARACVLARHTSDHRAATLEALLNDVSARAET